MGETTTVSPGDSRPATPVHQRLAGSRREHRQGVTVKYGLDRLPLAGP
ncbi:hypothetical protein [Jatrophihabitans lederbergiae]|uniref:Uncharacterized protein n=1 Tax=Jatrophihabitans lederbergiae TaxID=3075547 RepID=A0ABU2JC40_9ACTN|nr:hypothetical protein [Jatrophihabitans sp. DSM 44399]MDT0262557.1 hypothetical protein [Jatrophihabitans sp. DSM 44399]